MTSDGQDDGARVSAGDPDVFTSAAKDPAREAVKAPEPASKQTGAISSGPFEISPSSFSSPPASGSGVPSAVVQNAMGRGKAMPLSTVIAIGCGVFVVIALLTLLLFR